MFDSCINPYKLCIGICRIGEHLFEWILRKKQHENNLKICFFYSEIRGRTMYFLLQEILS